VCRRPTCLSCVRSGEARTGAIWAAQRMPRDHVTVVANAFVIGCVRPTRDVVT
jgi:dipeptidase